MAGATRIYGGLGSATLPLLAADIDDADALFIDPAQELLLDLLAAALEYELGDAWAKVVAALPPDSILHQQDTPKVVAEKWRVAPSKEHLSQMKPAWPVLCVTRDGDGESTWFTRNERTLRQKWDVTWMIGPVGLAEVHKLQGVLPWVSSVVSKVLQKQGHVAYQAGALVLAEDTSPFLAVELMGTQGGLGRVDEDGPQLLAITCALEGLERTTTTTDHLITVDGLELHEHLRDGTEPLITDFVVDDTTGAPAGD